MLASRPAGEQGTNLCCYGRVEDGGAAAIAIVRARALGEEKADDLALLFARFRRAAPAGTGGAHDEMQRRGAGAVWKPRIGTAFQQGAYGGSGARAHRAMQRRDAGRVSRVGVGARREQEGERRSLRVGLVSIRIRRVVQRFGAASISRTARGAVRDEQLRHVALEGSGCHV